MENQTRFDLNIAIENWKSELSAQPNFSANDRRELETHLRDTIAGLRQRGLNDEETFWLARRRIGQPQQLGEEFIKADPAKVWRERILWICLAVFLLRTINDMIGAFSRAAMPIKNGGLITAMMPEIFYLSAILIPLILAMLLGSGKMIPLFSKLSFFIKNRLRFAIAALVVIIISAAINVGASEMYNAKISHLGGHNFLVPIWQAGYFDCIYKLIVALMIVWLIPTQNRKTPKRA